MDGWKEGRKDGRKEKGERKRKGIPQLYRIHNSIEKHETNLNRHYKRQMKMEKETTYTLPFQSGFSRMDPKKRGPREEPFCHQ